ncbi:DUF1800 family protein [Inhella proteolytica]|uniref:DUF1800 family protein n=1 Tax=Inhella proteolytica TaxID=2795029 RepID=A0A931J929_9BURK|nr:DUF1800 family protein [Inhella proteolytica]MBH9578617.1 DUF1800 family protein [Inhella proteolytica]
MAASTPPRLAFLPLLLALCAGAAADTLNLRAYGSLVQGVGPSVEVRVNGTLVRTLQINNTSAQTFSLEVPTLVAGAQVDVVFTNDAAANGEDRNLYVDYLSSGATTVLPTAPTALIDRGKGAAAFDGVDTRPGQSGIYWNAALRLRWPAAATAPSPAVTQATRFLLQAGFGPRPGEAETLASQSSPTRWIADQMALPPSNDFVNHIQAKYALGADYRPNGSKYQTRWLPQRFWAGVAQGQDQLRRRTALALHHILMVSMADSNLYHHQRAYANYLDILNRHAFGNYRQLIEDIALSPAMGIYLSHIRNRKEDPATGRMPDENFARELMQLFTIGLHELNSDGSVRKDANGQPIETYTNADVMALAKVFTGWSWAFPDNQLTESTFRWKSPDYSAAADTQIDLQRMKAYPGQASTADVVLFAGKPNAVAIPGSAAPAQRLKLALDALFQHPNMGPFVAKQLIQRFTRSNPSPAYVQRVAAAFANNGRGVRGDLGATVRAVLLDGEAGWAQTTFNMASSPGKLREPVLRVAHWLRAFDARSPSGEFQMVYDFEPLAQMVTNAPSVFGYFRPGYTPPGTVIAQQGGVAPEFQIVNEGSTATWVNRAESMAGGGLGWNGSSADVVADYTPLVNLLNTGNAQAVVQRLNQQLYAGRMSAALQSALIEAMAGVGGNDAASQLNRVRIAVYVALSAPEFNIQ